MLRAFARYPVGDGVHGIFQYTHGERCGGRGHFQYSIMEKKNNIPRCVQTEFIKKKNITAVFSYILHKKKKKIKTTEKIVKSPKLLPRAYVFIGHNLYFSEEEKTK